MKKAIKILDWWIKQKKHGIEKLGEDWDFHDNELKKTLLDVDKIIISNLAIEQSEIYANNNDKLYDDWEIDDYHLLTNWSTTEHNDWMVPATKEPHYWCGQWNYKGCMHSEDHQTHNAKIFAK